MDKEVKMLFWGRSSLILTLSTLKWKNMPNDDFADIIERVLISSVLMQSVFVSFSQLVLTAPGQVAYASIAAVSK
ncbi:hypothetical protein SLA2020_202050 [Shorea laevis]